MGYRSYLHKPNTQMDQSEYDNLIAGQTTDLSVLVIHIHSKYFPYTDILWSFLLQLFLFIKKNVPNLNDLLDNHEFL